MTLRFLVPLALICTAATPGLAQTDTPAQKLGDQPTDNGWDAADWDLEDSEFTPEAGWHFGKLDNGMRYIVRRNDRPESTAIVRMVIGAGSIDERPAERGFAHYVEHMAFNGSTRVPEGEMIKLLERKGLAFGADTNASTGFEETQYKLDLPRAETDLLDTALMLMRETVSELTIAPEAVERERGVILSERRVRNNYNLKNIIDNLEFAYPGSLLSRRLPIGIIETLEAATAQGLREFWEREYVPADTVLVVIGDFDPGTVKTMIEQRFADWESRSSPDQPDKGPVDPDYKAGTDIYLDPALTETITLARHGPYVDRPDTAEERRRNVLAGIGRSIIRRRAQRLLRSEQPPFRGFTVSSTDFFEEARTTQLTVAIEEGQWKRGLDTAIDEYRRALIFGFTEAEIAEQVSNRRTSYQNAIANAATRTHSSFARQALSIARGNIVPNSPADRLARFEQAVASITPAAVLDELRATKVDLDQPLIRFSGKQAPEGGTQAIRLAVTEAFARELTPPEDTGTAEFAYTDFGSPGEIIADSRTEDLGIRTIRFANGVMLNLKPTDLADDRVTIRVAIDGGQLLQTRGNPLAVALSSLLANGGLGAHSVDQLQSILAGRSVSANFSAAGEAFVSRVTTTPRDFELQLQVLAALVTDPGYRAEGLGPWRSGLPDFYARLGKTPGSAYNEASAAILSDNDPRFTRNPIGDYQALDYQQLKTNIEDRLANGAMEIAIVGDFEEDAAIAHVAGTFGALPARETAFRPYDDARRNRSFTDQRDRYTITHDGEADQAMVRLVWPTTDNDDWDETSRLNLLARVVRLMLTEKLREELGQVYSPSVSSSLSSRFRDYGTFSIGASVDIGQLDAAKSAIDDVIAQLLSKAPDSDLVQRARQPILESLDNRLKRNNGWMRVVEDVQSEPEYLQRFLGARQRYEAMTQADILETARTYLQPDRAVEFRVVPSEIASAKPRAGA